MNSSASESDTSFTGKVGTRPKRSLKTKTLSWSDHVDKITYASDGESLLVEDRVSEKKPLAEENDKNKKGANVKRLRGTPMEGFQIMTLDDLNGAASDEQALVQGDDDDDDDSWEQGSNDVPVTAMQPPVSITQPVHLTTTETSDSDNNIVRKRPVPVPRTTKPKSDLINNNVKLIGTNSGPTLDNSQAYIIPPIVTKPTNLENNSVSNTVSALGAHGGQTENQDLHTEHKSSAQHDTVQEHMYQPAQTSPVIPNQESNNLSTSHTIPQTVHIYVPATNEVQTEPRVYYGKPIPKINKNSVETNIDEVTPLMSENIESDSNIPQDSNSQQVHPQPPYPYRLPPNQFMPMRGPYQMQFRGGPVPRFPMRPLFPQHFQPNANMSMQRHPMVPFPPRMMPPNWRPPTPEQMNMMSASVGGSPYSWQNESRDSPMSVDGTIQGLPPGIPIVNGQNPPVHGPPFNFSTGSSPVPTDVEPRYFTFEGREYPEGHPMLYPQYGMGAPSTMTGVTGYSVAPSMAAIGPSVMQDANPHLSLSIILLVLGNWIFGPIALVFSLMSRSSIQKGEYAKAAMRGRISLILNIIGMVVTVLFVVLIASMAFIGTF